MANESGNVQGPVLDYLKSIGAYAVNIHGGSVYQRAGIADILACYKGWFMAIECKDEGNGPSELQKAHGRKVLKAGGIFIVAYRVEHVKEIIEDIDEGRTDNWKNKKQALV